MLNEINNTDVAFVKRENKIIEMLDKLHECGLALNVNNENLEGAVK